MGRKLVVPSADVVSTKWKDVTPARAGYYESETPGSSDLWEQNTRGAKGTYKAAVADPKISDRFDGGVKGKAAKFKRKVEDVGVSRYGPGIEAAEDDMKDGIAPFLEVLDGLEVSDRGPRGASKNYKIVNDIGDALHKKRLSILGAAGK